MIQFCYWQKKKEKKEKKQSWKIEQNNAATKEGTVYLKYVSGILPEVIRKITSFPNSFHGLKNLVQFGSNCVFFSFLA